MYSMMPGSTSPERVPITNPSSGVMPMLVSMECPLSTAVMLAPLPRWAMIIFISDRGRPSKTSARRLTYSKELP